MIYRCHDCGRAVPAERVRLRDVTEATTRSGAGGDTAYRQTRVNLCPGCARARDGALGTSEWAFLMAATATAGWYAADAVVAGWYAAWLARTAPAVMGVPALLLPAGAAAAVLRLRAAVPRLRAAVPRPRAAVPLLLALLGGLLVAAAEVALLAAWHP
jgi:hypothetical protein